MASMTAEYHRQYRQRRKAEGRPLKSGVRMPVEYFRAYRETYLERPGVRARIAERAALQRLKPSEQPKTLARVAVRRALEAGRLLKQACEVCGNSDADAHHNNYDEPLKVRWLCRIHHSTEHAKARGVS